MTNDHHINIYFLFPDPEVALWNYASTTQSRDTRKYHFCLVHSMSWNTLQISTAWDSNIFPWDILESVNLYKIVAKNSLFFLNLS